MDTFEWDDDFETGLDTVDEQHHTLVDLINRFGALLGQGAAVDPIQLEQVYGELARYAQYHFREEQDLMEKTGLDARYLERHRREYATYLAEIERFRQQVGEQCVVGARLLLKFLIHWLAYHILDMDKLMARQMTAIRSGMSPSAAFENMLREGDAARSPLLKSLNSLFELVTDRNRQLYDVNRNLELKVAERTQDLTEANRKLLETIEKLEAEKQESLRLSGELAAANKHLETLAMTDLLTGLYNRRHAMDRMLSEISAARRYGGPLSLILLDADGFKAVNDTYGHDAGDEVIKTLGALLRQSFRTHDVVCRMGGDEFLVICPRTAMDDAFLVAERVRLSIASQQVKAGEGYWQGSISVGVADYGPGRQDVETLNKAADRAVYDAKRNGRNCVVKYQVSPPNTPPGLKE